MKGRGYTDRAPAPAKIRAAEPAQGRFDRPELSLAPIMKTAHRGLQGRREALMASFQNPLTRRIRFLCFLPLEYLKKGIDKRQGREYNLAVLLTGVCCSRRA